VDGDAKKSKNRVREPDSPGCFKKPTEIPDVPRSPVKTGKGGGAGKTRVPTELGVQFKKKAGSSISNRNQPKKATEKARGKQNPAKKGPRREGKGPDEGSAQRLPYLRGMGVINGP